MESGVSERYCRPSVQYCGGYHAILSPCALPKLALEVNRGCKEPKLDHAPDVRREPPPAYPCRCVGPRGFRLRAAAGVYDAAGRSPRIAQLWRTAPELRHPA